MDISLIYTLLFVLIFLCSLTIEVKKLSYSLISLIACSIALAAILYLLNMWLAAVLELLIIGGVVPILLIISASMTEEG